MVVSYLMGRGGGGGDIQMKVHPEDPSVQRSINSLVFIQISSPGLPLLSQMAAKLSSKWARQTMWAMEPEYRTLSLPE
jgi:hypothetical protein